MEEIKGTKNIPKIKLMKERMCIPKIKNKKSETIKTKQRIANVLAIFFENLNESERENTGGDMKPNTEDDKKRS